MDKIKTIIGKEWAEVFKNRLVLFTVAFLPLILTALPIAMLFFTNSFGGAEEALSDPDTVAFFGDACIDLTVSECTQVYVLNLFVLMLMILPLAIPVTIAAYSVVGEKTSRSLEPLLATPITTMELLLGKIIAAAVPAVLATWVSYIIYMIAIWLIVSDVIFAQMVQLHWLVAIFVVAPLLTLLSVSVAIIISSRTSDPRVAEQLSAVVVMPVVLLMVGQSVGLIFIDNRIIFLLGFVVAILDMILLYLSIRLFQRETILTRWK